MRARRNNLRMSPKLFPFLRSGAFSMLRRFGLYGLCMLLALVAAPVVAADDPGLPELDEATQLKVNAKTLEELGKVADLSEKALEKGLTDANKKFAVRLITSSLFTRASEITEAIFGRSPPDPRWPQLRRLAMTDLERALKVDGDFAPAHLLVGRLQSLPGGDHERAVKAFGEAIRLAADDAAKAEGYLARAGAESNPEKQLADYNEAVKLTPKSALAIRSRGLFQFARGKNEEALADLDAALKLEPDNVETHEARGVALLMLKRLDDAIGAFDKAIELANPKVPGLYTNRARAYALKEDMDKALADLGEAIKINPNELGALLLRARVYQMKQEFDKAMEDVSHVLRLRPGLIAAIEVRAGLYAAQGKFNEAITDLELLAREDPKDKDRLMQLGVLYNAAKKPRRAIEIYDRILKLDAADWGAMYGRADALLSIGKHVEAVKDYEEALKHQPKNSGILNNLAWVLATSPMDNVRNGKRAVELGKLACEITEYKKPHIISTLAAGYAETGDWAKAVETSQKAVDTCEDDDENKPQLLKELQSYKDKKPWRELQNEDEDNPNPKPTPPKSDSPKAPEPSK
jgi:tetratricopeptide (TPR) repeat protein